MARLARLGFAFAVIAFGAAVVGLRTPATGADPAPSTDRLNKAVDNVTFTDGGGKASALKDHAGKTATVVVFLSFDCPVSNSYASTLAALHKTYAEKGVGFVALVPTDDDAAKVAKKAAEFKYPFPVFSDSKFVAAEAFKATVTPEAFVLDQNLVLRYRGRIDNAYSGRLKKNPSVTEHDLKAAIEALVAGKDVPTPATRAIGCHIDPKERKVTSETVTYHRDVAAHPPEALPELPPAGRRGAVRADDLQAGGDVVGGHRPLHAEQGDAAVEAGGRRRVRQRPRVDAPRDRHAGRVGEGRLPRGRPEGRPGPAQVHRRLAARRAGPRPHRAGRLPYRRDGQGHVPLLRAADSG